ncbi:molybdopterin synthase sulfur carrier subunit MoaD [Synechococcus elongatus]|uniref:Molybdopterin synthase sulfur carrier subunit n=1 Tax=Synechococcus elongatus (strain ATCC 33912 / PCC 7942 / FACHB-805) TaxID=1140 RepID=MOAD_SYNE7|nr:molybdopterin synthase sulfur carrier subunit MoaD [Synechococcus elongatus]Q56209.1 RecName: Full=Molybdopterin synthase sulfur carrier subunit; AltName: Full=MPT synthase subunit 1; AltName: Full=Molybdenum cofactor biosynthesis protein D; AltName: Full=Molybdopterin-converting factor small subunit; AltName: Full=Molybdopterin-converting factor subunit 1; AltName: Full=Sulfur carrier protein MoaD [Synechococcus elongatus PCC 7942 = FACHB-805]ABB57314.1 molybdopterin converting factor subunit
MTTTITLICFGGLAALSPEGQPMPLELDLPATAADLKVAIARACDLMPDSALAQLLQKSAIGSETRIYIDSDLIPASLSHLALLPPVSGG